MKAALFLFCVAILGYDILCRRVPNPLLLLAIVLQTSALLIFGCGLGGLTPMQSLLGFALAFVAFFPLHMLGAMGAGDVKVFAVLGLLLGAQWLLPIWLIGSALALVHAIAVLAMRGTLQYADLQLEHTPISPLYRRLKHLRGSRSGIPYAGYLAAGTMLTVLGM
jgi:prepilin peptidase CpaA